MGNTIYKRLFGDCEVRVLLVGMEAAGKTTILYKLKLGEVVTTIPTTGFIIETISHKDFAITAWDVGGRLKGRAICRHYKPNTDAIVCVIDSADRERYQEAVEEFLESLSQDEVLSESPFLILANKQDCDNVMTPEEITEDIRKRDFLCKRQWKVFGVSAKTGEGLYEGLDWLTKKLAHLQYRKGCLKHFSPYQSIQKSPDACS